MRDAIKPLDAALRALARAVDVEQAAIGAASRATQMRAAAGTDRLIVEAIHAGASAQDIAVVLDRAVTTARDRIRRARKAAGEWQPRPPAPPRPAPRPRAARPRPEPDVVVEPPVLPPAPNFWLAVQRCGRVAPPPWPVSRCCGLELGHGGEHDYSRRPRDGRTASPGS